MARSVEAYVVFGRPNFASRHAPKSKIEAGCKEYALAALIVSGGAPLPNDVLEG